MPSLAEHQPEAVGGPLQAESIQVAPQTLPPTGAWNGQSGEGSFSVLDPKWVVVLLRWGFLISALSYFSDMALSAYLRLPRAHVVLPNECVNAAASLVAFALTFQRSFERHWKLVTLVICLMALTGWTITDEVLGQPESPFITIVMVLMASCALVPWELAWQACLTAFCLILAALITALFRPASRDIGELWGDVLASAAISLMSNRILARWRSALAASYRHLRAEIAERRRTQDQLEESEARLRRLLDASMDQVSVVRMRDGRIIYVNDQFLRRGYRREHILGRTVEEIGMWTGDDAADEFRQELGSHGMVRNREVNIRLKDGRVVPHLISSVIVELGGERCALSVARDISEIKRSQHELIAARETALAASKAKSEFLSSMSHEIRTPMNAILGMADMLAETPLTPEQRHFIEIMANNGTALMDLINGILDLAKVESGRLHLEEADFDLDDVVAQVTDTLAPRAHEKGLELIVRILPELPRRLIGDPLRLRQVLINLIGNALRFTQRGEVLLTIENDPGSPAPGALRFSVTDTGVGIPADKLEAIFNPFTQADPSTTRNYGGSGLGLAIARRLAEAMGGQMGVESSVGRGSTFHFTARFRPAESGAAEPAEPSQLTGSRVLVVDDNATTRAVLSEMLTSLGAEVEEAPGPERAMAQAERAGSSAGPYQVALVDSSLPSSDALEIAAKLRRLSYGSTAVVLMPGCKDLDSQLARARAMGLEFYVVKPVRRRELLRAITAAMGTPAQSEHKERPARPIEASEPQRRRRILLAEDSPDNRAVVKAFLKDSRFDLDIAENGEIAVQKFQSATYDLVLMDMRMPVVDGYTAVRTIREWEQRESRTPTPIVALSASALESDVRSSLEAGCDAHLSKPIRKSRLLAALREFLAAPAGPSNHGERSNRAQGSDGAGGETDHERSRA